eukprot:552620-Prorocentrum_minimum.AAC.4
MRWINKVLTVHSAVSVSSPRCVSKVLKFASAVLSLPDGTPGVPAVDGAEDESRRPHCPSECRVCKQHPGGVANAKPTGLLFDIDRSPSDHGWRPVPMSTLDKS